MNCFKPYSLLSLSPPQIVKFECVHAVHAQTTPEMPSTIQTCVKEGVLGSSGQRRVDYCTSLYILRGAGGSPPLSGGPLD